MKIRNPKSEIRNKLEYQKSNVQHRWAYPKAYPASVFTTLDRGPKGLAADRVSSRIQQVILDQNDKERPMAAGTSPALPGRVASLHLHPEEPGAPLQQVDRIELVEAKGITGDNRYFSKLSKSTGQPNRRQVTLIEREQIAEHATALGLGTIPPGRVRSNIETTGINLIALIGREVEIGGAVLFLYAPRDPCAKMDAICMGLRERMMNSHQGVLAEVRRTGVIQVGDEIRVNRSRD